MKHQRLLGFLWLGLLLFAAVFIILWGRIPTKDAQTRIPLSTARPETTTIFIAAHVEPHVQAQLFTVPPSYVPAPTPTPSPAPEPEAFSLFWYSDTQYYAYKHPEIFRAMTRWSVENAKAYGALAVLHTGDIVDNHKYERHWKNASSALTLLKGYLPLYCVAGNHDVGADSVDYTMYRTYAFCDVTDRKRLYEDGVCWVQPLNKQHVLLLGIGWQKGTACLSWVHEQLSYYPDYAAILLVHSFLEDNGSLTPFGKLLESELLASEPSIRLVLCGHKDGSVRWQKAYDENKRTVNAVLYNYQDDKQNGLGYLRILTFHPDTRSIDFTTYSPYLDDYNYYSTPELDTFTLYNAF